MDRDASSGVQRGSTAPSSLRVRGVRTFAALKYPNYRLWFYGQMVSLFGTWMQTTAQGFLIFELTRSPRYLGLVGFAAGVPTWLLTLYGGVVADRIARRQLMMITQSVMMMLAFILAALTFLHVVQPWHVLVLASLLGVANSFDAPARQAFVGEMVEAQDLTNAIALNATMFNTATAVGPAVAGICYALFGPAWCFAANALSFIAVIAALQAMTLPARERSARSSSVTTELREGARYLTTQPTIRMLIAMVAVTSMFALSFATLIPAWSVNVLHGNAAINGLLFSARGLGALAGALGIASLGRNVSRGRILSAGSLLYPLLLFSLAFVRWIPLSLLVLGGVGIGTILVLNLANALVQSSTPEYLRGRVMGTYTWIFFGSMPLGALWNGMIAERFGEPAAVMINAGVTFLFASAVWVWYPKLRAQ